MCAAKTCFITWLKWECRLIGHALAEILFRPVKRLNQVKPRQKKTERSTIKRVNLTRFNEIFITFLVKEGVFDTVDDASSFVKTNNAGRRFLTDLFRDIKLARGFSFYGIGSGKLSDDGKLKAVITLKDEEGSDNGNGCNWLD